MFYVTNVKGSVKVESSYSDSNFSTDVVPSGAFYVWYPDWVHTVFDDDGDETIAPPTRDHSVSVLLGRVSAQHVLELRALTGGYSPEERETWNTQLSWASDFLSGKDNAFAKDRLLELATSEELAGSTTEEVATGMAQSIEYKAWMFEVGISRINGMKRKKTQIIQSLGPMALAQSVLDEDWWIEKP